MELQDKYGDSPLHKAAKLGDADAIRTLLTEIPEGKRRRLMTLINQDYDTPLQVAVYEGHLEAVIALLQEGEITEEERGWAVRIAANEGDLEMVRAVLRSGNISEEDCGWAVKIATNESDL